MNETRKEIVKKLQKDILHWEGFKTGTAGKNEQIGLGPIEANFPNGIFPKGVMHEFINTATEDAAACSGFIGGLLASLMRNGGACVWISISRRLFPPSLRAFGVAPDRIVFVDLMRERDVLWVMEEALKCEGLAGVVCELNEISFTQSRRLQLAVESSKVTGFILRGDPLKITTTACVARWRITPVPSVAEDEMPGVGFQRWNVGLLRVRNGNPGVWKMEWAADRFMPVDQESENTNHVIRQVG